METNATSIQITGGILPGQHYTCNVAAVSDVGSVSSTKEMNGVTSEDGKFIHVCMICTKRL